jgi:hypothetical protein
MRVACSAKESKRLARWCEWGMCSSTAASLPVIAAAEPAPCAAGCAQVSVRR